jgi:hypothetical protein
MVFLLSIRKIGRFFMASKIVSRSEPGDRQPRAELDDKAAYNVNLFVEFAKIRLY